MKFGTYEILIGDVLEQLAGLESGSVQCCVTSPPYWGLRDYGDPNQIGLESRLDDYVSKLVRVFAEVRRVLRDDGTLWLNLGDSYAGSWGNYGSQNRGSGTQREIVSGSIAPSPQTSYVPSNQKGSGLAPKNLIGVPWRVAFALQADGWILRNDVIWSKPNPMPSSVQDRMTMSHEYIFMMSKSERYWFDQNSIRERSTVRAGRSMPRIGGIKHPDNNGNLTYSGNEPESDGFRNPRSVWEITTVSYSGAHFATFPEEIPRRCILAGSSDKGCCPECGKPWVRVVEKDKTFESGSGRSGNPINGKQDLTASATNSTPDIRRGPVVHATTIGFRPGCECGGEPVPSVVLDPFLGSGTTLAVGCSLGRNGIGIELNPEYAKLARKRIETKLRPNTARTDEAIDSPLFETINNPGGNES